MVDAADDAAPVLDRPSVPIVRELQDSHVLGCTFELAQPFLPQLKSRASPRVEEDQKPRRRLAKTEKLVLCGASTRSSSTAPQPTPPSESPFWHPKKSLSDTYPAVPLESSKGLSAAGRSPRLERQVRETGPTDERSPRGAALEHVVPKLHSPAGDTPIDHLPMVLQGVRVIVAAMQDLPALGSVPTLPSAPQKPRPPITKAPMRSTRGTFVANPVASTPATSAPSAPEMSGREVSVRASTTVASALAGSNGEELDVIKTAAMMQRLLLRDGHRATPRAYFIERSPPAARENKSKTHDTEDLAQYVQQGEGAYVTASEGADPALAFAPGSCADEPLAKPDSTLVADSGGADTHVTEMTRQPSAPTAADAEKDGPSTLLPPSPPVYWGDLVATVPSDSQFPAWARPMSCSNDEPAAVADERVAPSRGRSREAATRSKLGAGEGTRSLAESQPSAWVTDTDEIDSAMLPSGSDRLSTGGTSAGAPPFISYQTGGRNGQQPGIDVIAVPPLLGAVSGEKGDSAILPTPTAAGPFSPASTTLTSGQPQQMQAASPAVSATWSESADLECGDGEKGTQRSAQRLTREEDAHFIAVSEPAEDDSAATTEAGKVLARLKCSLAEAKVEAEKGEYLRALQLVSDVVALGSEPLPRPKSETMVRLDLQAPKENEAVSDAVVARHQLTVASALYERGKVLLKLSLWSSAAKDFSESIAWLPDEAYDTERLGLAVRWERAHLLGEQLKHAEALALTDELLAPPFGAAPRWMELTGKERAAALELRARCLVGLGQDDAALDQLTALKLIDGARPSARRMAAGIFKRRNDVHSALRELRAASILDPSDGELCAEVLGLYMAGVDKTMAVTIALEYLDELIVEDPTSRALLERATLRVALARLLPRNEAESHYAGASADLDRVFALCDRNAYLYRGCLEAKVKPKRALSDLKAASSLSPRDPRPHLAAGAIYESMGDAKRALQQYAEAFRRNSDDPYPLLAISGIHTHYRPANLTAAINYATRAIELRPGCLRAHAIRADAYFRSGETKLALRDVCRAQHLTPSSMTIMGLKAYYLQALGRTYDAAATCSALAAASCAHSKAATESASEEKKAIADAEVASMTGRRRMMPSGKDCGTSRSDLLKDSDCMNKQSSRDLETRSSVMVGGVPPAVRRLRHFTFEAAVLGPSIVQRLHVLQAEARLVSQSAAEAIQLLDGVLSVSTHNHDDPMRTALDQSMLAVARQIAGDLRGAHASMQVAHKLAAGAGPDHGSDWSTIWLRDGHLRLAMHDARGALASYGHARRSNPHSGLAHEAIGWARFTLRLQCETAQALGTAVNDKVPDQAEEGDSDEITCSEGDGEEVGGEEEATDEEGLEGMRRGSKVESLIEGRREVMPKVFRRRRRLQMNKELGAFRRANKLTKGGLLRARLHLAFVLHRDGQHSRAASELEKVTGGLHSAAAKAPEVSRELANILVLLSLIQLAAGQVAASMLTLREAIARGAGKLRQGPFRLARFAQGTTLLKLGSIGNAVACLKEVAASFDLAPITRRSTGMSAQPRATTNRSLVRAATAAQSGGLVSAAEMVRRPDALLAFAAHFNLGLALERQEAAAGASRAFSAALLLAQKTRKWPSPDVIAKAQVADCHIAHGMVLLQLARAREAAAQFDSALRLEPPARSKLQALLGLGHTRVDVGDVVGARRIYSRASLTFPREAAPCVALARLFHHSDKTAAALRSIATALELAPNHPDALEVRAAIRLSVRGTAGSIADLEACTSHSSDASEKEARPGRCITLAMVRMQIGEQKPARKEHSLLGHEDSDVLSSKELRSMSSARKLTAMGYHAAKRGEWEQSAALYDEASQLMAVASASLSGSTDGDTKGADYPASGTQRSNASGRVNPNAGEVDLGSQFELIPRPTSGCPSIAQERVRIISGRASFGAGLAYAFLGDFDIALVHFDQAVHFRPDCGFTMYNRALLHLTAQRWDLAEVDLKGCVERLPLMPDGWLKKSDAIIAQGNKGRMGHALSDYANALVVMDFDPRTRLKA